jgi:hypothetical protein
MHMDWYSTYKGDKNQFKFPKKIQQKTPQPPQPPKPQNPKSNNFKISDEFPLDLNYVTYVEQNMKSEFATYAYWTLREAMVEMEGKFSNTPYTKYELINVAENAKTIKELTEPIGTNYINSFKQKCINSGKWYGYDGNKLFNEITKHIPRQFIWDEKNIREDFKNTKYKSQSKYRASTAGNKALELGIFDELAGQLPLGRIVWTHKMLIDAAKPYKSYTEMAATEYGRRAYDKIKSLKDDNLTKKCFSHWDDYINGKRFEWTLPLLNKKIKELGIKTKMDLRKHNLRGHAQKFGIYDKFISTKK